MAQSIVKQPNEALHPVVHFATAAPIAAVLEVVVTPRALDPGVPKLLATAALAGGVVTLTLSAGADGERYLVTVRARDVDGGELESEVDAAVVEAGWQMPDGSAPMLSIADFVDNVGVDEAVRMTDPDGSGRIWRPLLVSALTAAQGLVEANIAGRYALPLASVPVVLATTIVDLARPRLYPRGAPEGVDEAAKAALRTLERIADGKMTLGLPAIVQPAAPPSLTPILVAPGRRQYPDALADY